MSDREAWRVVGDECCLFTPSQSPLAICVFEAWSVTLYPLYNLVLVNSGL